VPFAWCGALWALAFTKTPLDLVGSIAAILLVGIVVKNGIVLIDCARRLMDEGLSRDAALKEAGRIRLRPILMTAATTILGLVPTAVAVETGSTISYKALAVATIGGMTVATLLQLYVVPAIFAALDDARVSCARILGFATSATESHAERASDSRVS
jgi:HAE1 family hydrophobic/amphiphilic exporter-1